MSRIRDEGVQLKMLSTFLYGFPFGIAFACTCLLIFNGSGKLIFDAVTAVLAVVAIVAVALWFVAGDPQAAFYAIYALFVVAGPPIAGFAVGASVTHGIAKYAKR